MDKLAIHTIRSFIKAADERGMADKALRRTDGWRDGPRRFGVLERSEMADAMYEAARSELMALLDRRA